MEIRLSTKDAYEIATRHESTSRGNGKEMDQRNSSIGRQLGRDNTGKASAGIRSRDACKNGTSRGKLWITKSGKLVRSNA
ncbi:hypothetical protein ACFU9X_29005 [Streptomyces atratus]|uniref:hypothetical protein n=1 Tax=Streptomyces atratus TaxID=1893 RepID=UPI0036CE5322